MYLKHTGNENNLLLFLKSIIKWGIKHQVAIVWGIENARTHTRAYDNVFPSKLAVNSAFHSHDAPLFERLKAEPIPLQAIDSDFDLIYH